MIIVYEWEQLKPEDIKLVEFMRELKYGDIEITVRNGKPVLIKQATKNIKLEI